jgi:hypothetical protein
MPNVLTTQDTVLCGPADVATGAHGGTVNVQSAAKLSVGGAPVLAKDGINGKAVTQCGTKPKSDAGGPIDVPCTIVSAVTAGEATKLFAGGHPVVLDTSLAGETDGMVGKVKPQKRLAANSVQTKLRCV